MTYDLAMTITRTCLVTCGVVVTLAIVGGFVGLVCEIVWTNVFKKKESKK